MLNKNISFLTLGVVALVLSGGMMRVFNDPEGPNLFITAFFAAIGFAASLAINYFYSSTISITGYKRLLVAIVVQLIVFTILYFALR